MARQRRPRHALVGHHLLRPEPGASGCPDHDPVQLRDPREPGAGRRVGDTLHAFWRDSGPTFTWKGPVQIATGAAGNPVLIQSRFGQTGNFELAYPLAAGGIGIKWRNNDAPGLPWSATTSFGQTLGPVDGVSMIQSNFGTPGNLEVVAHVGSALHAFWRDSGPTYSWNGPYQIL